MLVLALSSAGCVGTVYGRRGVTARDSVARESTDQDKAKADLYRLEQRVDGMAATQQDLQEQVAALRSAPGSDDAKVRERLAEVERKLADVSAAQAGMKQEIVDDLSRRMADVLQARAASSAASVAAAPGAERRGREHVVQPGQTLSSIASSYGVPVSEIVRINGLKNANAIRAGQKLIIPEAAGARARKTSSPAAE
jgi:LysM repeat protein